MDSSATEQVSELGETCTKTVDQNCDDNCEQSPEDHSSFTERGNDTVLSSSDTPTIEKECKPSLEYCLEPRPPHAIIQDGSESPKDIQNKLIRKVNLLNSNGEAFRNSNGDITHSGESIQSQPVSTQSCDGEQQEEIFECNDSVLVEKTTGHGAEPVSQKPKVFGSFFKRKNSNVSQKMAASSTTGLIFENRPNTLPAKSLAEQKKHQKQYEEIMVAAKRKEIRKAEETMKYEERKKQRDKMVDDAQRQWSDIIPKWDKLHNTKKVRELWWLGLPPGVRGTVWKKAIGNELNISHDLYKICLRRCKERLEQVEQRDRSDSIKSLSREGSVEVIYLDVQRTFPTLGFFQEGGPYHSTLHDILGAYACYRPDVGYVQGMSFIAAVILLNMDAADAFVCLANLLNRSSYLAFFRMDHDRMIPYFETYDSFLKDNLPSLHTHLSDLMFKPEFYLIEWIFTIYTRVIPLDLACRVWDIFCRDGDIFLYKTALGILKMYHTHLLSLTSIEEVGYFLGHIPTNTDSNELFQTISTINISEKKYKKLLLFYQNK